MNAGRRPIRGFTLIEVLVALAIVATALVAGSRSVALSSVSATEVKQRILAGFVAENLTSALAAYRSWPELGAIEGSEQQGPIEFPWRMEVLATPHPRFRRVEVHVFDPNDRRHELRHLVVVVPREN